MSQQCTSFVLMTDSKKKSTNKTNSTKKAPAKKPAAKKPAAKKKAPAKKKSTPKVSVNDAASSLHDAIGSSFFSAPTESSTPSNSYSGKNWLKDFFKKLLG